MTRSSQAETESVRQVPNQIQSVWPMDRWMDTPVIVAVSGGPDSMALLHALTRLSTSKDKSKAHSNLIVSHVNHGTRGKASDEDAEFVRSVAKRLSLPFYLGCRPAEESTTTNQSESSLREFRYRCLREAAASHGARYLVTGHTLDDQVETVLFRILRGTGLRGLTGIPAFRKLGDQLTLVRPMLSVTREETEAYLNAIGQSFRIDSSNRDSKYTRNFLRNELLPLARTKFPDIDRAIVRLGEAAQHQQNEIPELVAAAQNSIEVIATTEVDSRLKVNCQQIACFPDSIIVDAFIEYWDQLGWPRGDINRLTWQQLAQLLKSEPVVQKKSLNLPGNLRAIREGNSLTIKQNND